MNNVTNSNNMNNQEINEFKDTSIFSITSRVFSAITFPISYIASIFENLVWRIIDPNWKSFVAKGQGHFVKSNHKKTLDIALTKMDQIFTCVIDASTSPKKWHLVHKNMKKIRNSNQIWSTFSKEYGGTCFGNCVSLASHILEANHSLTINELKKFENTDLFVANSQALQLLSNSAVEYNKKVVSEDFSENASDISEGLFKLGLTLEYYKNSNFQDRIRTLIRSDIEKNDLSNINLESLLEMNQTLFIFNFKELERRSLKKHTINPGIELIKQFELLPSINQEKISTVYVDQFKETLQLSLINSKSAHTIVLTGISNKKQNGHAMLMEIDNLQGIYILYDNNRGFYQWNDLQSCLLGVEMRLKDEKYDSCDYVLNKIGDI